ncbi:MAG: hypothetical protein M3Q97_08550, partial [Bacteroidota bacterium]|nr:hypothetical protein [Bacteroidota bacterium]
PEVVALVALAAPARPIDSLIEHHVRHIYRNCADSAQGETIALQLEDIFGQIRNGTWDENTPVMGAYPKFWREWIGITDSAVAHYKMVQQPTLFIQGMDDFNVPPDNGQRFEARVTRSNARVLYFDSTNHFLTHPAISMCLPPSLIQLLTGCSQMSRWG